MELSPAHWIYLVAMVAIIAVMIARKNIVLPAIAGTFLTVWVFTGSLVTGLTAIFNASLTAASELFNIFLIIALVTALLGAMRALGADRLMVTPFQKMMKTGTVALLVIFAVTFMISLFFWPTPAVPLIGAILIPAAVRAGLPPIGAAMAIAIAGQGMALGSDYIIKVAPGLSAVASSGDADTIAERALLMSVTAGVVALVLVYLRLRRDIQAPDAALLEAWENRVEDGEEGPDGGAGPDAAPSRGPVGSKGAAAAALTLPAPRTSSPAVPGAAAGEAPVAVRTVVAEASPEPAAAAAERVAAVAFAEPAPSLKAKAFAVLVPLCFLAIVVYMILGEFTGLVPEVNGGDAAGLVGGSAAILLLLAAVVNNGRECLEDCATHVVDGLVFAFKAMGVVIPIAGFFFLGNPDLAPRIMGLEEGAVGVGFLFDLITSVEGLIPGQPVLLGLALLLIGIATGLDGSGFSGLPLTGSLAGSLAPHAGMDVETLAAIGQVGAIFAGGGTLVAWSSLLAVAGVARVSVLELVRRLFVPVMVGLVVATVVTVLVF